MSDQTPILTLRRDINKTLRLPLELTSEQKRMIDERCKKIRDIAHTVLTQFPKELTSDKRKMTQILYSQLRDMYPEVSSTDIVQCIRLLSDRVAQHAALKKLYGDRIKKLARSNSEIPAGLTNEYNRLGSTLPELDKVNQIPLIHEHCRINFVEGYAYIYGFVKSKPVTFKFQLYSHAREIWESHPWKITTSLLVQNSKKQWLLYVHLYYEKEIPIYENKVLGVFLDPIYLVTYSTKLSDEPGAGFATSNFLDKFKPLIRSQQIADISLGFGSETALKARERRLLRQKEIVHTICHEIAGAIVKFAVEHNYPIICFGWGDMYNPQDPTICQQEYFLKVAKNFPYRKIHDYLKLKAYESGIEILTDDTVMLRRTCPACGWRSKENLREGNSFHCVSCNSQFNACECAAANLRDAGEKQIKRIIMERAAMAVLASQTVAPS